MPHLEDEMASETGRLERGDLLLYPDATDFLPSPDERTFLASQQLAGVSHKNITYNPTREKLGGYLRHSPEQSDQLCQIFATFSRRVTDWLTKQFPRYALLWQLDRVSYCPIEEATRRIRFNGRNDLLHIDSFPTRPSHGWRILRVFVNLSFTEACIWATSDTFSRLLDRFGSQAGLPTQRFSLSRIWEQLRDLPLLLRTGQQARPEYDSFMLRLHNVLKDNEDFQERSPRRLWTFPPGSAWICMTDSVSHAALRGQQVLDHSYFLAPESLALPGESPAALLARVCGFPVVPRAA